jgi:hypothetical protein
MSPPLLPHDPRRFPKRSQWRQRNEVMGDAAPAAFGRLREGVWVGRPAPMSKGRRIGRADTPPPHPNQAKATVRIEGWRNAASGLPSAVFSRTALELMAAGRPRDLAILGCAPRSGSWDFSIEPPGLPDRSFEIAFDAPTLRRAARPGNGAARPSCAWIGKICVKTRCAPTEMPKRVRGLRQDLESSQF